MLHPSYNELFDKINSEAEGNEKPLLSSRYSVCLATAKRARQLIAGADQLVENPKCDKPLSIAVDEIYSGKVVVLDDEPEEIPVAEEAGYYTEETT